MEIEAFVDAKKAAEFLNVRPRRLLELARAGSIPAYSCRQRSTSCLAFSLIRNCISNR
jgi:hypothetical protein